MASGMSTLPRWIRRTQTVGLIVTGAAIGHYYVSPALRVEEVSLPPNTLLAKARMFGNDGKRQVRSCCQGNNSRSFYKQSSETGVVPPRLLGTISDRTKTALK